jgi:hypothetical protein
LNIKPYKRDLFDFFNVLSHTFPYEQVLNSYGLEKETPLSRPQAITEFMQRKGVKVNATFFEQMKSNNDDMWDGLDRFVKIQELAGKACSDARTFQANTELQV